MRSVRNLAPVLALLLSVASVLGAQTVPAEADPRVRTATFSMYCYWTGEATLGRVEGVLASRIGHWGGSEIVQVDYDPEKTDLAELVEALERQRSLDSVVVTSAAERREAAAALGPAQVQPTPPSPGNLCAGPDRATSHRAQLLELLRRRDARRPDARPDEEAAVALKPYFRAVGVIVTSRCSPSRRNTTFTGTSIFTASRA